MEKMPLTVIEQLDQIPLAGYVIIRPEQRKNWQTKIYLFKKRSAKRFSIRTEKETRHIKVWRTE